MSHTYFDYTLCAFLSLLVVASSALAQNPDAPKRIQPMEGNAWLGCDGARIAWLSYKQIDDGMVRHLLNSRVNTVFLRHGFHDLMEMASVRREKGRIVFEPRAHVVERSLESTHRAAAAGIHVFWLANYELEQMLPHLKRLGYQSAYAEGPGRYLRPGPHDDASPLDPVFWRGITGAHGEFVAKLSRKHPIDGMIYDTEHYAAGMMYLQNSGFCDGIYRQYAASRKLSDADSAVPAGQRYDFLKSTGRLPDYYHFLEEQAFEQGSDLAARWHAINPQLVVGVWPLLDNWFSQGFLRGLGGAVPSLGLSGVEYYHGAEQSASLADYFHGSNPNMFYVPGFYPPFAYSTQELGQHVEIALRDVGHYWMLGPYKELARPEYQASLRTAFEAAKPAASRISNPLTLLSRKEGSSEQPLLVVTTQTETLGEPVLLSLFDRFGGVALCEDLPMQRTPTGYEARIPLVRRITGNRRLPDTFRGGAHYRLHPVPREFRYEDPHHTKLIDGAAYGYFGTTVAWNKTIDTASVEFDLHRDWRIKRVEAAQPTKLEDRVGGPARLRLSLATVQREPGKVADWKDVGEFQPSFAVSGRDYSEPDSPKKTKFDPRHNRAWLSWKVDLSPTFARQVRIDLQRQRPNSSLSLGEVVIHAIFDGQLDAQVQAGDRRIPVTGFHMSAE